MGAVSYSGGVQFVWFEDPFGERLLTAEFDVAQITDIAEVVQSYRWRWRVSVRLHDLPDTRLSYVLDLLQAIVDADGGVMWEIEDSVLLLTPSSVQGPPTPASGPGGTGGDPSGDRSPLVPVRPRTSGAVALPPPALGDA